MEKLWRYVKPFSYNTSVSRTDGQTDGQTDRIAISISRVSSNMLTRDKNWSKRISWPNKSNQYICSMASFTRSKWSALLSLKSTNQVNHECSLAFQIRALVLQLVPDRAALIVSDSNERMNTEMVRHLSLKTMHREQEGWLSPTERASAAKKLRAEDM